MTRLSVITLTWNHLAYTQKAVESLAPLLTNDDEWIFVDNCSTDGTQGWLMSKQLPCKSLLHICDKNTSISEAYNIAIKESTGDYVLIWDNDLEVVMPNTIEHLLSVFRDCPDAGIVCPMLPNIIGRLRNCTSPDKLPKEIRQISMRHKRPYPMCASAAWLISRKCIEAVGLFDEQFDKYGVLDFDYARRVLDAGFKIYSDGFVWVNHYGSITAKEYMTSEMLHEMHDKFAQKWGLVGSVPRWRRRG